MIDIIIVSLILLVVYLNRCGRTTLRTQKGGMKTEYIVLSSLGLVALIAVAMYYALTKPEKVAKDPPAKTPTKDPSAKTLVKAPTLVKTFGKAPIAALANIKEK